MESERAGAGVAPAGDWEELPLTIWLAGDEPFFAEFTLDAAAAMKVLGIKRSRLTQISGCELRVGKVRSDRYTRAMYRAQDVEAYRSWTRRTAAHQRSAEVVKDAASRLDSVRDELLGSLSDALAHSDQLLQAGLKAEVLALRGQRIAGVDVLSRQVMALRALLIDIKNHDLAQMTAQSQDLCL